MRNLTNSYATDVTDLRISGSCDRSSPTTTPESTYISNEIRKTSSGIKSSIEGIGCLQLILHSAYACVKLDRTLDIPYMKLKKETDLNVLEKYQIYSTLEQNFHLDDNGVNERECNFDILIKSD